VGVGKLDDRLEVSGQLSMVNPAVDGVGVGRECVVQRVDGRSTTRLYGVRGTWEGM
jgi:hypothetical protein